eukprot:10040647-Lingulodinium_polyedra.AAC.1
MALPRWKPTQHLLYPTHRSQDCWVCKHAVIDSVNRRFHSCGPGDLELAFPPGFHTFELEQSPSGPVSEFHTIKPASNKFARQGC